MGKIQTELETEAFPSDVKYFISRKLKLHCFSTIIVSTMSITKEYSKVVECDE